MQAISEVMTRDASAIAPDANLDEAAQLMRDLDIGALPVCEGRKLVGMLTDRDITIRAVAEGKAPNACTVADVMTREVSWCFEDQSVGEVMQQMGDEQVRRLPVLSRDSHELVGMVSLGDLALRQGAPTDSTLEDISAPFPPPRTPTGKQPGQRG